MEYLIVAVGVWFLWNVALTAFSIPDGWQYLMVIGVSCGGAAWIEPSNWWYGIGLAGVSSAFMLVGDLLLVTTDWIRAAIFKKR